MYQGQTLQERQLDQKRRNVLSYKQNTENPSAAISKPRQHNSLAKGMADNPGIKILTTVENHYLVVHIWYVSKYLISFQ